MNAWTQKPTDPGLYLYDSERGQRLPVAWDGQNCWIVLPLGTAVYGRRAIMFRPAHGLFWRIPDPPAIPRWEAATDDRIRPVHFGPSLPEEVLAPKPSGRCPELMRIEETPGISISGRWGFGPRKEGRDDAT